MCVLSRSVVSNCLWSFALWPTRLLCPWDSPGSNTGVGCHFLLQGIFPTQGWNLHLLCLLPCRWLLYLLSLWGSPQYQINSYKNVSSPSIRYFKYPHRLPGIWKSVYLHNSELCFYGVCFPWRNLKDHLLVRCLYIWFLCTFDTCYFSTLLILRIENLNFVKKAFCLFLVYKQYLT